MVGRDAGGRINCAHTIHLSSVQVGEIKLMAILIHIEKDRLMPKSFVLDMERRDA